MSSEWAEQPFRALLLTFVLQALATGLMLAGAQYLATWVLRSEDAVTLLFVALIAPALVAAPAWGALARRAGKERSCALAGILFTIAALSTVAARGHLIGNHTQDHKDLLTLSPDQIVREVSQVLAKAPSTLDFLGNMLSRFRAAPPAQQHRRSGALKGHADPAWRPATAPARCSRTRRVRRCWERWREGGCTIWRAMCTNGQRRTIHVAIRWTRTSRRTLPHVGKLPTCPPVSCAVGPGTPTTLPSCARPIASTTSARRAATPSSGFAASGHPSLRKNLSIMRSPSRPLAPDPETLNLALARGGACLKTAARGRGRKGG